MRSSKTRSRSKTNRNRPSSGGNVINRVFDSSGPEGKVRGTPQQIIDKYNQLARDAQLGNDRVATENFQQHAEHYLRLLSEAQREIDTRREEQERQNRERQAERDRNAETRETPVQSAESDETPQPDVVDLGDSASEGDSNLVETPESAPKKPRRAPTRSRKPAAPKPDASAKAETESTSDKGNTAEAAE